MRFYLRTPIFIFSNVLSDLIFSTIPCPVVVQSLSRVWLFVTPQTAAHRASPSFTISQSLLKLMSIKSMMPSNHLILCQPLLLLPSIFRNIKLFSSELVLHNRWPKYWNFNISISPSGEYSGLISFKIDWFDLLEVQGTLKSLLQHHSLKASISWGSAFLLSGLYIYIMYLFLTALGLHCCCFL